MVATFAQAASVTWTGTTSTDWNTAGNWTGGTGVPGTGDVATFTGTLPGNFPVLSTGSDSVLGLLFSTATGGWTLSDPGSSNPQTLTLGTSGIDASAQTSGTTTISVSNITLGGNQTWTLGSGSDTAATNLNVSSAINVNGKSLTIKANGVNSSKAATVTLSGSLSGTGTVEITGNTANGSTSVANLTANNSAFTGTLDVRQAAQVNVTSLESLGSTTTGTVRIGAPTGFTFASVVITAVNGATSTQRLITFGTPGGQYLANNSGTAVSFLNTGAANVSGDNGTNTLQLGGSNTGNNIFAELIGNGTGTDVGAFQKQDAGKWILTGNNTYTGATTISAGTLQIGNGGTTGSMGTGAVTDSGTLIFNRSDTPTVANVISGTGSVSQQGTGTLTLSGPSTYAGATTVNTGTLLVSGSLNGTVGVTVSSGATLASGATGSITTAAAGNISVSGTLAPGGIGSVGTLTLAPGAGGHLSFAASSTLAIDISGATSDQVAFSSSGNWLLGSGNVTLSLNGLIPADYTNTYTLFSNVTTGGFNFAGITGYDTVDYVASFTQVGSNYQLSFIPVPEPGAAVSMLGGLGMLAALRRRPRRV